MKPKARIKCPTCRREGDWFGGRYGPFCSRRCKLVDLGKWFGEEHVVSRSLHSEEPRPPSENADESQLF